MEVLILQGTDGTQRMLRRLLNRCTKGCLVLNGSLGEVTRRRSALPSLVVIELPAGRHDGIQIIRRLNGRSGRQRPPVLAISTDRKMEPLALDAGAGEFLQKPVLLDEFRYALARLGLWELLQPAGNRGEREILVGKISSRVGAIRGLERFQRGSLPPVCEISHGDWDQHGFITRLHDRFRNPLKKRRSPNVRRPESL